MPKKSLIGSALLILAGFLIGMWLYPSLPDTLVSHWDINGNPNGYMSKFWGLFLMPIISTGILALMYLLPKIDPLKKNFKAFYDYYSGFIFFIIFFLFYINLLSVLWNVGFRFSFGRAMAPALGALFFYIGILLKHAKRNWFVGIRTPWTLSNDKVWDKTHQKASTLFKFIGIISIFSAVLSDKMTFFVIIFLVFAVVLYSFIYSYLEYRKLKWK